MKVLNTRIAIALLLFFGAVVANAQNTTKVSKWPRGVTYEIFVQSFADSDGDGIGDFNGMTAKLDYLQELGVEGIWLMPIGPSTSYHKYNVDDYYDVHPDYGTLDDFKRFVSEAHKRNINVVIDLVINHSGRENKWFQEALKNPDSEYWHYYVWAHKDDPAAQIPPRVEGQRRRRGPWNHVEGNDYVYFSHFGGNMPDLNFDNPKLQQEVFKVGEFWLKEVGVDGFRLDAARHIFVDERATDNHKWWEYFLQEMKKVKEDVYIIGEVWAPSDEVAPYLKGIPALFNFDMGSAITKAVKEENPGDLVKKHKEILDYYKTINPDYIDATFLTNHDQNRILSSLENNLDKARMAAAILFTLPGAPYIYYGEEIGMIGQKPDPFIREPFLWDVKEKDKFRATWEKPRHSADSTVTPLTKQLTDKNSLVNHYKELINLRNTSSALTYGDLVLVESTNNPSICAFIRSDKNESLLVLHNLSGTSQSFVLPQSLKSFSTLSFTNKKGKLKNGQAEIPAYSTVILKTNTNN
jgi:alpha-amylase